MSKNRYKIYFRKRICLKSDLPHVKFVAEREEENRRVKSLLPWKQKNKETFVVLRGTTLNQFNIDFVQIAQKFKSEWLN